MGVDIEELGLAVDGDVGPREQRHVLLYLIILLKHKFLVTDSVFIDRHSYAPRFDLKAELKAQSRNKGHSTEMIVQGKCYS